MPLPSTAALKLPNKFSLSPATRRETLLIVAPKKGDFTNRRFHQNNYTPKHHQPQAIACGFGHLPVKT
jgi:hypothetical protein